MYCKKKLQADSSGCYNAIAMANKPQTTQHLPTWHCGYLTRSGGQLVTSVSATA